MDPLQKRIARLYEPVEVDDVGAIVRTLETAFDVRIDTTMDRISDAIQALQEGAEGLSELDAQARRLQRRTGAGQGMMAQLLSTLDDEGVEDARSQALYDLRASCAQLARSVERAVAMADDVDAVVADIQAALDALTDLHGRAVSGGHGAEARAITEAQGRLRTRSASLGGVVAPITAPAQSAGGVLARAMKTTVALASTERQAALGEAVLDATIASGSGPLGQVLRQSIQQAAPGLIPDLEREASDVDEAHADLAQSVARARREARSDEALRRAAEAELDALEWE